MTLLESVLEELADLQSALHPDEFAYLALTTKIEGPLRDRWAYRIHRRLGESVEVSREWRRTDIALLEKGVPKLLIELKAMYTFDAVNDPKQVERYGVAMTNDEVKARKLSSEADVITVLLVTHPLSEIPLNLRRVVKYDRGVNAMIRRYGSPEAVHKLAVESLGRHLADRNVVAHGNLVVGSAFGVSVEIMYWAVAARRENTGPALLGPCL